jgi:phosphatidylethanolamine/phosphatidyl-N-methylethanolamine N-methyltransferase
MLKNLTLFGSELLANPRAMGAACPSSPLLARRIAALVGRPRDSYVLELGAGTGAITAGLLRRGLPMERLVILERSPGMVKLLRRRFPGALVVEGDAADIHAIVRDDLRLATADFSHIVSSLPLRSIPRPASEQIATAIQDFLCHGAKLIQYTYDLRKGSTGWFDRLGHVHSSVIWFNVPPARVDLFSAARQSRPVVGLPADLPAGQTLANAIQ